MNNEQLDILYISMLKTIIKDPGDNFITLRKERFVEENYIIYAVATHLIEIYKLLENSDTIEYHIYHISSSDESNPSLIIANLIKRYLTEVDSYKCEIIQRWNSYSFKYPMKEDNWQIVSNFPLYLNPSTLKISKKN